jgi:hypothetical protein
MFLPSNDMRDTDTHIYGEIMKGAIAMGSGAMMCIPGFIKIGSGTQKLMRVGYTDTDSMLIE